MRNDLKTLEAKLQKAESERDHLCSLLVGFVDNKGCILDNEGRCDTHFFKAPGRDKPCKVNEARIYLERIGKLKS